MISESFKSASRNLRAGASENLAPTVIVWMGEGDVAFFEILFKRLFSYTIFGEVAIVPKPEMRMLNLLHRFL